MRFKTTKDHVAETNRNRQKRTEMVYNGLTKCRKGQKQTKMDKTDKNGDQPTEMNRN